MSERAIVAKVWNFATILRDSGVSYTEYVAQLSYLLFLKMESERESIGESSKIPTSCKWERLIRLDGLELESAYNAALVQLAKSEGVIGLIYNDAQNKIKEPANLKKLFVLMDSETWLGLNVDVKGAIYEGLLAKNATETKAGAGQYFTPRVLIDSIVGLMELKPNMEVCDPACGTGGFLLSAYEAMKAQTKDKEELKRLRNERLCGKDITPLVASLCAMNLYLHGIGGEGGIIEIGDSLSELGNRRFDRVLTNPPFGKKSATKILAENGKVKSQKDEYNREDFFATTSNKQLNFLQHIMNLLKIGGKAAVVLPDNVLFETGAGEKVRKKLLEDFNLHTILRLPTGIFYAQGVKANVLFFGVAYGFYVYHFLGDLIHIPDSTINWDFWLMFPLQNYAYSVTLVLSGVILLYFYIKKHIKIFRIYSLLLFILATSKVFLLDTSSFGGIAKIVLFIFMGIVFLLLSYIYSRYINKEQVKNKTI
ncbi:DUF2339 domain-containing protein [Helicobacter typhlonius]|uniref:type I restriction-modification system subunit M n=2 Tax=Helicobacter typhlonius TaxID=76936 RepID=UPI002FE17FD1